MTRTEYLVFLFERVNEEVETYLALKQKVAEVAQRMVTTGREVDALLATIHALARPAFTLLSLGAAAREKVQDGD